MGQVISTDLLTLDLLDTATSIADFPGNKGSNHEPINLTLLNALKLNLGTLQLPLLNDGTNSGLLDLGALGVLNSYAAAPSGAQANAAAGVVGEDGAIAIDGNPGGATGNARIDVTSLLNQLGASVVTADVIDKVALEVGALASTAEKKDGTFKSEYALADAELQISSPLVGGLTTELGTAVDGVGKILNDAVATDGDLGSVLETLNLDINLLGLVNVKTSDVAIGVDGLDAALDTAVTDVLTGVVQDDNGTVKIDLGTGKITVDLAKLVKNSATAGDLNGLAPDTQVLTASTIDSISDGVAQALGNVVSDLNTAVKDALKAVELVITVKTEVGVLFGLSKVNGDVVIRSTLGGLAGVAGAKAPEVTSTLDLSLLSGVTVPIDAVLTPVLNAVLALVKAPAGLLLNKVLDAVEPALEGVVGPVLNQLDPVLKNVLAQVVQLTINDQESPGKLGDDSFTVSALTLTLLPQAAAAKVSLATSSVRAFPSIVATPATVESGKSTTITGEGYPATTDVVVQLTDAADAPVGGSVTVKTDAAGEFSTPLTVPAGTTAGSGYKVVGSVVAGPSASTGLTVTDPAAAVPAIVATPATVESGKSTTITGEGYPATTDVVVQLTDAADAPVGGSVTVKTDAAGEFTTPLTVPAGTRR